MAAPALNSPRSLAGLALLVAAVWGAQQWWSARQEGNLGRAVAARAAPGDIRMLASDHCAICLVARRWFVAHGVPFSECSIERDATCRAEFQALQAAGTPVLVVRGVAQLGFSPQRLHRALQDPGRPAAAVAPLGPGSGR